MVLYAYRSVFCLALCASMMSCVVGYDAYRAPPAPRGPPDFCTNGVVWPSLPNGSVVEVTILEAPLLSIHVGKVPGELLDAFHIALFFEVVTSDSPGTARNYTLEFDSVNNMADANIPQIVNNTLEWHNDARYCLREGLLYGRGHWSQQYTKVGVLQRDAFLLIGTDFLPRANVSAADNAYGLAEYSFTQVMSNAKEPQVLFRDVTCATGAMAVLAFAVEHCSASLDMSVSVSTSHWSLHTDGIQVVDMSNQTNVEDVKAWYGEMAAVFHAPGYLAKLEGVLKLAHHWRYVYRQGVYYALKGTKGIWGTSGGIKYKETPFGIYVNSSLGKNASKWANELGSGQYPK